MHKDTLRQFRLCSNMLENRGQKLHIDADITPCQTSNFNYCFEGRFWKQKHSSLVQGYFKTIQAMFEYVGESGSEAPHWCWHHAVSKLLVLQRWLAYQSLPYGIDPHWPSSTWRFQLPTCVAPADPWQQLQCLPRTNWSQMASKKRQSFLYLTPMFEHQPDYEDPGLTCRQYSNLASTISHPCWPAKVCRQPRL